MSFCIVRQPNRNSIQLETSSNQKQHPIIDNRHIPIRKNIQLWTSSHQKQHPIRDSIQYKHLPIRKNIQSETASNQKQHPIKENIQLVITYNQKRGISANGIHTNIGKSEDKEHCTIEVDPLFHRNGLCHDLQTYFVKNFLTQINFEGHGYFSQSFIHTATHKGDESTPQQSG